MRLLRISLENLSVMCEIQSNKSHYNATHFVLHQFYWEKWDHRKVKFLTIDFTEGVILQPFFIYDPSNIIPKANDYVVC